jgi:hypothetical protein
VLGCGKLDLFYAELKDSTECHQDVIEPACGIVLTGSDRVPGAGARFDARYAVAQFLHCCSVIADKRVVGNVG